MDCLKNCVIIIPAKICNQRQFFSHDLELNNKGILHFTLHLYLHFTYNAGLSIETVLVRIPLAAVSKLGDFRSLHDAPVDTAV